MTHIPTAEELRARLAEPGAQIRPVDVSADDLARVRDALADHTLAISRAGASASDERARAAHAGHVVALARLADEVEAALPVDPAERKLTFGSPKLGAAGAAFDYRKAEVLAAAHSTLEWVKARDASAREFTDYSGAWNALAAGLVHDDWDAWRGDYKKIFAGLSSGGEGGELIPAPLSGDVIDLMRSATPIFQAGATTVPMTARTLDIARVTADPASATWHAEAGTITPDTAMTLDKVTFTAKTLPVIVKASMELAEDAGNLGEVVRRALAGAIGVELTKKALRGDGTANTPTGIRNSTGVEAFAIGANGGPLTIDMLIDRVSAIRGENAEPNALMWNPRTAGGVTKLAKDANGVYFELPSPLAELDKFATTAIPKNLAKGTGTNLSEVYFGQWSQLLIGMRTNLRIRVLDQRYADTGEIAFMAWLRADVKLAHGEAFSVITDTTT